LEVSGDQHSLAIRQLEYFKVSTGEKSRLAGTIVGGLLGATVGAFAGAALERSFADQCFDYCGLEGGIIGLGVGGIGGAIGGYHWLAHERFTDVHVSKLRLGLGREGFSLVINF